jgi:hypothetical protein
MSDEDIEEMKQQVEAENSVVDEDEETNDEWSRRVGTGSWDFCCRTDD